MGLLDSLADGFTCDGLAIKMQEMFQFTQNGRNSACCVQILHVADACGLQIDKNRRCFAQFIHVVQVDGVAKAARNCGEMDDCIGRAAKG